MSKRQRVTKDKGPTKKKAKWSKEQTELLIQEINKGESVSVVAKLFPDYTQSQVHSKVSNLKQSGKVSKIASTGIAPSLQEGFFMIIFLKS